ncbi:NAD(P)-dependent alcohol dehydrogenase [Metabacillus malikii]|uniref:NADPH:quinone reductase-like Zn-dependent oxidoreductase n=1 Tax=Metabacillus malikii TaxID=1504265 RepID=A0ABT9ZC13_9BACI|nr:NAD(P)-dependent alcohol dehydrogenase [Metabacillus malikii]MDQ0229113.1 NADPH:quinone reductase-like Zn-dependent oxidoreductase [Metabacillus malikii]
MKAVVYTRYGSPDVLELKQVEKPIPKEDEILVKIKATTVTVADIRSRSFTVPPEFWLPARLTLGLTKPKKEILGVELAGEVVEVGRDVKRFKEGDQVFAASLIRFGTYAEYICLKEDGPVAMMPSTISYGEAAALPIGARTALFFLKLAGLKSGQSVLVYGASGSVGSYVVQLAKHLGATVTGVCSTKNVELVKSLGADNIIDYTAEDFSSADEIYDVIFEAVNKSSFSACMKVLKNNGTYINVTEPLPTVEMLWTKLTSSKKLILSRNSPETSEALDYLKELIETGKLKVVIDRAYSLDKIVDAHRYVEEGHKRGNVVINVE